MICGLLAVTTALLLKFRFANENVPSTQGGNPMATDSTPSSLYRRDDRTGQSIDNWASILGYLPGESVGDKVLPHGDITKAVPQNSNPLLEQNRIAVPLGICVFAICVFILLTSTYGYSHTHNQLADGRAFAGSWR